MREGEESMIAPRQPETYPEVCKTIKYNASFVLDVQLKLDLAETYAQVFKFDLGNSHCSNH